MERVCVKTTSVVPLTHASLFDCFLVLVLPCSIFFSFSRGSHFVFPLQSSYSHHLQKSALCRLAKCHGPWGKTAKAPRPRAPVGAASAGLQSLPGSLGRGLGFGSFETSGYLASRGCPSSRLLSPRVHTRNAFDHLGQAKFLQSFFFGWGKSE
ncbi:hypothetical protein IscW_ISCW009519 [Ixodes scapularis]|uniref:Uncharacterized protein n=1 Tax=Ixodes scapularis TaxID=6945 RepID=B7Q2W8_IXOSC|nr:hypothetical protein IscW_ISCW009519 [Ixodes scapularis]|eukprot:XP_002411066.1 hypothetical protein IscW_ISCW009519 [Ixodes scapularis]